MMTLEEIKDKIFEGDVLEKLRDFPDDSIDITVTSPPYNKRNKSQGWLVNKETYSHFNDHMAEDQYQTWQINVLTELLRVTKPGGSVFYNHKVRWDEGKLIHPLFWIVQSGWHIRQEIIWDRSLAANMRGWRFWQIDERIYWLYKPIGNDLIGKELLSKHAKSSSIWRLKPVPRMESHPAPFPLELPIRAIYSMPDTEGKIVLDPFCGTGTTLVAAKLLGHSYSGIDISPTYIELAQQRIQDMEKERSIMNEEIARHVIDDPFVERKKRGTVTWPYGPKNENNGTSKKNGVIPDNEVTTSNKPD